MSNAEVLSGMLLCLRQKYYLPYEALALVNMYIDEMCEKKVCELEVEDNFNYLFL